MIVFAFGFDAESRVTADADSGTADWPSGNFRCSFERPVQW